MSADISSIVVRAHDADENVAVVKILFTNGAALVLEYEQGAQDLVLVNLDEYEEVTK